VTLFIRPAALALLAIAAGPAQPAPRESALPLRVVAEVPLPGPSNRFDYTSLDARAKRLYIAHMDANEVLLLDLRRRRVVRSIPAPGVHGVRGKDGGPSLLITAPTS
jgi:hypothetical protein